jgi:hypothetical protein
MKPKIKIYDRIFAHAHTMSNGEQNLEPLYFTWYRGDKSCDVAIYTDFNLADIKEHGSKHKYNIALLMESPEVFKSPYGQIKNIEDKFKYIFTFNEELLSRSDKYISYRLGGTWIPENDWAIYHKTKMFSMITSVKTNTHGQRMRHEIKETCSNRIDIYGKINNNAIKHKLYGLKDYRYSIVTENCQVPGYFTEKIIDCFLTGTVPIYWGDPKIDMYFQKKGIIQLENVNQLIEWLKPGCTILTPDMYGKQFLYIAQNFKIAKERVMPENEIGFMLKVLGVL